MTDNQCFLPISVELQKRMRQASERVDLGAVVVLFDGTKHRPWGRYLTTEREDEFRDRQKPLRNWRELTGGEMAALLYEVTERGIDDVAARYHLHPESVRFVMRQFGKAVLDQAWSEDSPTQAQGRTPRLRQRGAGHTACASELIGADAQPHVSE